MIDWTKSMSQTFEFYQVDPGTWKDEKRLDMIETCTINRDNSSATLEHASLDCSQYIEEAYVRIYLIVNQNGEYGRFPLGTYLVQTPSVSFDGKKYTMSMDAYSPLIELKDNYPTLGYSLLAGQNIMNAAYTISSSNSRAPIVEAQSDRTLYSNFVANTSDNWLTFLQDLIPQANFQFALDEMGRILFEPITDTASLQPVWTFSDDNSSILLPNIKDERDLYGVPNVVEVIYSSDNLTLVSRVVNDDPSSPVSTKTRGREIVYRETSPQLSGIPTQSYLDSYAIQLLRNLSSLEHKVTFSHGYCPIRVGDCVLLDYKRFGINGIKAKLVSQSIKCGTGCSVEATAVYTTRLWG